VALPGVFTLPVCAVCGQTSVPGCNRQVPGLRKRQPKRREAALLPV